MEDKSLNIIAKKKKKKKLRMSCLTIQHREFERGTEFEVLFLLRLMDCALG